MSLIIGSGALAGLISQVFTVHTLTSVPVILILLLLLLLMLLTVVVVSEDWSVVAVV